jgi:Flp pilus assembly protein TadD
VLVARAAAATGDLAGARALLQINERARPNDIRTLSLLGAVAANRGDRDEALRRIAQIGTVQAQDPARRSAYQLSWIYAALGDRDRAFAALDVAFRQRYPFLWHVRIDPELDPLRGDPRMAVLIEKLGL